MQNTDVSVVRLGPARPSGRAHRLPVADLLIAVCAERSHLVVLHYDAAYVRIAEVTGQREQWVVPRGSVP